MNETAYPPPPAGCFLTTVSMIHSGRFWRAGEPMPLSQLEKIPPNLRKKRYLSFSDPHAGKHSNGDAARNLIFETNTQYSIDQSSGDRHHQQQIAREINLEQMRAEAQEQMEEQVRHELEHPDEQTIKALEILEAEHRMTVEGQVLNQQFLSKEREAADRQAKALAEEDQIDVTENLVTPTIEEPKPQRVLRTRYVVRNGAYLRAKKAATLKVSEKVYVKEGSEFVLAGKVNRHKKLPLIWKEPNE